MLSEEVVKYASSLGFELSMMEVIKTQCLPFDLNSINWKGIDAIVFTSENAVNCFFNNAPKSSKETFLEEKKIISTSGKTAEALIEKGFSPPITGKNAEELSQKIIFSGTIKSVLHICGDFTIDIIKRNLENRLIKYKALTFYNTIAVENKKPGGGF